MSDIGGFANFRVTNACNILHNWISKIVKKIEFVMEDEIIGVEMNEQIKWIKSVLGFVFE